MFHNGQSALGFGMSPLMTNDAMQAALGFVISQTAHIERQVNMMEYPEIQYSSLIPVDFSAHPFAKSVTYYSGDMFGAAKWINGNADDVPLAGTELAKHETMVYTAAIGYGYGWEEIGMAQLIGRNLPADDALAANRAYEEFVDGVALVGDASKNFGGLFNNAAITPVNAPVGNWGGNGTTDATILADVNFAIMGSGAATKYTHYADTVLLPYNKVEFLGSTRLGDTTETIFAFLQKNNVYTAMTGRPLTIRAVRGLSAAGVGPSARMIAYRRSPDVLKMHIPMPLRWLNPWAAGPLRVIIPGVFRIGGLDIRRPLEVRYVDGI